VYRTFIVIAGVVAFLSEARGASAFTTYPVDPVIKFERQADPDQLSDKMSNGQSRGTNFGLPSGQLRLQFSGPSSGDRSSSPFVTSPSTVFVPSEHW
jgi:hypothetical protein